MNKTDITVDYPCPALDFAVCELAKAFEENPHLSENVAIFSRENPKWRSQAKKQGYTLYLDGTAIVIAGADVAGALYGALDLAGHFAAGGNRESLQTGTVNPYILRRGIKFNIPLDARTPGYSDSGDSAQENIANMWDMHFWQGFLDRMALNKFNVLSLWNLSPFPSLVTIPEYPGIALGDVKRAGHIPRGSLRGTGLYTGEQEKTLVTLKKMTIEEKIDFWRRVMQYGADRCIDIYLFTWNIYVYGTQYAHYGITDSPSNPITKDYVRRGVAALVRTYPLLRGIGVTAGENMRREWKTGVQEDVEWIRDTYGQGIIDALIHEPDRKFSLIHRAHMTGLAQMEAVFSGFPYTFEMSYKYAMAHVYSAVKPCFGDAFFSRLTGARKTWLTLRNDDLYLLRWGDLDFVRSYLIAMPHGVMRGFYLGADGIVWGKDYAPRDPRQAGAYFFDRHWFCFALWGRLAYRIEEPVSHFRGLWKRSFGHEGDTVYEALQRASKAIPLQERVYWHDFDFQWYPEASASYVDEADALIFHTIDDFIQGSSCPDAGYLSIADYCDCVVRRKTPQGITPLEASEEIETHCIRGLELLETLTGR